MNWSLVSYNQLVHVSGAKLRLIGGTWRNPQRIVPANVENLNDREIQALVAEGIMFVKQNISELELNLLRKLEAKKSGNNHTLVRHQARLASV